MNLVRERGNVLDTITTHEERIRAAFDDLTPAERQLASHILKHYPVAALGSITKLADAAGVSTPTVVRLVQKIGFKGYPDFQIGLREEVEERLVSPLTKHDRWSNDAPKAHILNAFADSVVDNLHATLAQVDPDVFDDVCKLMADPERKIYTTGGRITHAIADYFVSHMQVIREGVSLIADTSNNWPHSILGVSEGDVLLVFDIRRYQNNLLRMVEAAVEQGAEVVLITDPWVSPVAPVARHRFSAHIEVPSGWDSTISIMVLIETMLAGIQRLTWDKTQDRMKRLEDLYDRTRFFRRK